MWSSLTAVFGIGTQSNYQATCAFMDSFAQYRRNLGLPATSLDLGHIANTGNIRRNPGLAGSLTRNGLYGNSHKDFLRFCDAALSPPVKPKTSRHLENLSASARILAGVGVEGLKKLNSTHQIKDMGWYRDPRLSHLVKAVLETVEGDLGMKESEADQLPKAGTVADRIRWKLAQLLFISPHDIDVEKPITVFGIDSLVAAELR